MESRVNKTLSFLSGVALLFLFSCADKERDIQPEFSTLPQKATTWRNNSELISSKQLFYDGNNNLKRFVAGPGFWDATNIIYDQKGRIYQLTNDKDEMFEQRNYNADGVLTSIINYNQLPTGGPVPAYERILIYNSEGKLRKVKQHSLTEPTPDQGSYNTYTYNAAGLIATDSAFKLDNGVTKFYNAIAYQYDDKAGLAQYDLEKSFESPPYRFFKLNHNITSQITTWANGNVTAATMEFEYNRNGSPTRSEVFSEGKLILTTDFEYLTK
jgi:hypothetical protein